MQYNILKHTGYVCLIAWSISKISKLVEYFGVSPTIKFKSLLITYESTVMIIW